MTVNNTTANDSELLEQYRKTIARQAEEIKRLKAEIEELKKLLGEKGQSNPPRSPYSPKTTVLVKTNARRNDGKNQPDDAITP